MTKRIYKAHHCNGGSRPLTDFSDVANLMRNWPHLEYIDSYESLARDIESEMDQINQDFYRSVIEQFLPVGGFARVNKLETVDDYLNFDIQREPDAVIINSSTYRDDNRIPVNRKPAIRHYQNDGVHGRSIGRKNKVMPGMDDLWEAVNRPYDTIDRNDVPYYGQREDEGTTLLMNTSWNE